MPKDVHAYVLQCKSCRKHWPSDKHQQLLKFFPPSRPLEFVNIDILESLTWTKARIKFIVFMTDKNTKLTWDISISRITAPQVAKVVLKDRIMQFGIPNIILTNNSKPFTSKCFAALYALMDTKLVTKTEYDSQCNGQVDGITVIWSHDCVKILTNISRTGMLWFSRSPMHIIRKSTGQ